MPRSLRPESDNMAHITVRDSAQSPSAITTGLIVVSIIFPFISAIAIILRFQAQRLNPRPLIAEDFWFVLSWLSCLSLSILVWVYSKKIGINYYTVDPETGIKLSLQLIFLGTILVQLPLSSVKIAILLFYKRIFTTRTFAICVWITITLISIWGVLFAILELFQIDPISLELIVHARLRFDSTALGLAQVGSSIALDVLVLCFPVPLIFRLHMSQKRRWQLFLVFWLGLFCVIAAVVRLILLYKNLHDITTNRSLIYLQDTIFIFKVIEPNASIFAACLPTYGPLIKGWSAPRFTLLSKTKTNELESQTELNSFKNSNHRKISQEAYRSTEIRSGLWSDV
ncbi:hypothetical protein F4803DRAFT_512124 [Xylaria telfairii]|nr:hypothetical protein F4803DRAFT_512124 [Xylaria telfairii]